MSKFKVGDRVIADPTEPFVVDESQGAVGTVESLEAHEGGPMVLWDGQSGSLGYQYGLLLANSDSVNHPSHYKSATGLEVIDVIEAFDLDRYLANVVKYVLRSPSKGNEVEDLKKAVWYLQRKIDRLEAPVLES